MRPKVRILLPPLQDFRPGTDAVISNLLKIIKIMETFTFRFCTLWVTSRWRRQVQAAWKME